MHDMPREPHAPASFPARHVPSPAQQPTHVSGPHACEAPPHDGANANTAAPTDTTSIVLKNRRMFPPPSPREDGNGALARQVRRRGARATVEYFPSPGAPAAVR